jgi:hypothetical protein
VSRVKRLPVIVWAVLAVLAVAACGGGCGSAGTELPGTAVAASTGAATTSAIGPSQSAEPTQAAVPPEPVPSRDGTCPYLQTAFVADTNGQRVSRVRVSADEPHPACFFYRADGNEQLRVQVLVGVDPAVARAVVDRAAPVASSDPATLPGGWEGGRQPTATGAVFAVAKAGSAVVVVTNQKQTIKASRIAEQAIAALGL